MRRDPFLAPLEFPLVKETEAWGLEGDCSRGLMDARSKHGSRTRFVMVFEKADQLLLVVKPCVKMFPHGPAVTFAKAVIKALVVGVIEPLFQHRPFQVPIDLGHEAEVLVLIPNLLDAFGQNKSECRPQVRSKTSGNTSIAMSRRTPSHCPAIFVSSAIIACCVDGLP